MFLRGRLNGGRVAQRLGVTAILCLLSLAILRLSSLLCADMV